MYIFERAQCSAIMIFGYRLFTIESHSLNKRVPYARHYNPGFLFFLQWRTISNQDRVIMVRVRYKYLPIMGIKSHYDFNKIKVRYSNTSVESQCALNSTNTQRVFSLL